MLLPPLELGTIVARELKVYFDHFITYNFHNSQFFVYLIYLPYRDLIILANTGYNLSLPLA